MKIEMTWIEIITYSKQQREQRLKKKEQSLRILWENFKRSNICAVGVPKGDGECDAEKIIWRKHDWKLPYFDKRQTYKFNKLKKPKTR